MQKATPYRVSEIYEAIEKGTVSQKMIHRLAWDLKKIEAQFLTSIIPIEFAAKWNKQPQLDIYRRFYIEYTNRLTYFAALHILAYSNAKSRAQCCKFYISLIKQSLEIGNLNTAHALLATLSLGSITRLRTTWSFIKKAICNLKKIEEIFSSQKNYENYRIYIQKWEKEHNHVNSQNCLIPRFGAYLSHFEAIADNNPIHLNEGNFNFQRLNFLAKRHLSIEKYQSQLLSFKDELLNQEYEYNILYELQKEDENIQNFTQGFETALENLYEISKQHEPSDPNLSQNGKS